MARSTKIRSRWRRWSRRLALGVLAAVTASILIILPLRWIDPVTGSFILQDDSGRDPVLHAWVSWEQLGSTAALAVVAAEDQRYPVLQRLMPSLIENATADGYLFDLVPGGHDKKRSHNFVKRIGLWIRANVSKDKTLTAYTLRHSYAQALRDHRVHYRSQGPVDALWYLREAGRH